MSNNKNLKIHIVDGFFANFPDENRWPKLQRLNNRPRCDSLHWLSHRRLGTESRGWEMEGLLKQLHAVGSSH